MIWNTVMMGTETVINEVRVRECLWNPNEWGYKSKYQKVLAWQQVCAKVAPSYNTVSKEEQKEIERAVQLRWKTARDAYVKCKTQMKKSTYKFKNKYIFYDALTFLDRLKDSAAEEASDDSLLETSVANDEQRDPLETEKVEPSRIIPRRKFQKKRNRVIETFESRLFRSMQCNTNSPAASNSTRTLLQDDDLAFFNSLAPIVNDFDSYKKLVFRSRILELAMDIGEIRSGAKEEPDTDFEES